jgi:hypothetical protein
MLTYFSPRINGILQSKLLVGGNYIGFVSIILNSFNNASTTRCCTVFYVDLIRISFHVFLSIFFLLDYLNYEFIVSKLAG